MDPAGILRASAGAMKWEADEPSATPARPPCGVGPFRARNGREGSVTDAMRRAGLVQGLFLSTGIFAGGANTQNKLIDTAEILRRRLGFRGYLHLKVMPGGERGRVERAMQLADRGAINLQAPT